jgi:hypothetical protein
MAGRVSDRASEASDRDEAPETGQTGAARGRPDAEVPDEADERRKAETDIAAGDVADDLADFA